MKGGFCMYDQTLKAIVTAARLGSFSKAAEELYLSPTAVMKQVNQFEARHKLRLFERTARGITLTPSGEIVYAAALEIMDLGERALTDARRSQQGRSSVVRVGASLLYPPDKLLGLWRDLQDEMADFSLRIVPFLDSEDDSTHRALGSTMDVIAGPFSATPAQKHCQLLPLDAWRFTLAMPTEHPLAGRSKIAVDDLDGQTVMVMEPGCSRENDLVRQAIDDSGVDARIIDIPQFYGPATFNRCVDEDCLLLSLEGWANAHPSLASVPFDVPHSIPAGIMYSTTPNEATERFVQTIRSFLEL